MADRSVVVRLLANVADFRNSMRQAEQSVKGVGDEADKSSRTSAGAFNRMAESAQKNEKAWNTAGTSLAAFGAATTAVVGLSVKAAMDWESAWAGVTKTLPDGADFAATEAGLRNLARTLPATHTEIAAVAEAAGQLGVAAEAIVPFTKTMIDLGETTNLSADEAATSIAQLMNVMKTAPEDVGRLGAALVELGNNGASTEADIMNLASYLSGAGSLIGATESDVLALANTMTSLGINAERGGGVMTRTMQDIYTAVSNGGAELEGFAKTAGMSGAEFARAFEADPIRAIGAFTDGLAAAKDRGENVVGILSDLGIKGTQDTAVLLQMAGAQGMLNDNLDMGAQAWAENTALVDEANKRYDTTAAKLAIAKNNINDAAIDIGGTFLPFLADLAEGVAAVARGFADLPDPIQGLLGGLGGVAGVASLAGAGFLLLFPRVMETRKAFQTLQADMPGVATGLGKIGKAVGIAGAAFVAIQTIDSTFSASADELERLVSSAQALGGSDIDGQIESLTDEIERQKAIVDDAAISWNILGVGIFSNGEAADAADRVDALNERIEALKHQKELDAIASEQAAQGNRNLAQATGEAGAAVAEMGPQLTSAYDSLATYAAALGLDEEATEDLIKKTQELGTTLADFVNPLGVYTTMLDEKKAAEEAAAVKAAETAGRGADSWRDFVVDTGFSFDEYMRRLEEQVTAQTNWQSNMLILASRVSQGTLNELARMGPEGAPLVADLVNRSDAELDRFDEITALRSKEATDAWGSQLTLAAPVLAAIGKTAGAGVVAELAAQLQAGTITVAEIARQYGVNLAGGINPVLTALGRPPIWGGAGSRSGLGGAFANADGRVVDYYSNGGVESHTAEIAPAGAWRVWAEPETGGEAYIPLAPGKRSRSLDIWRETGRRLAAPEAQYFAAGGFMSGAMVPRPPSTFPFGMPISTGADATMQHAYDWTVLWADALAAKRAEEAAATAGPATPNGTGGLGPAAIRARDFVRANWGFSGTIGGYANRNIAGTNQLSKHALGKAIDVMTYSNMSLGQSIADYFAGPGRGQFGVDNVIWNRRINSGRGWSGYSGVSPHTDHPHIDFFKQGGILNPHVRDQGGPLLPGYTFNGTGMRETVIPTPNLVDGRTVSATLAPADIDRLARAIASRERPNLSVDARGYGADQIARQIETREQRRAALASAW